MEIPTDLVKDGRAAHNAIIKDTAALEHVVGTEATAFDRLFIDYLPQILIVGAVCLILGTSIGFVIGRHLN